MAHLFPGVSFPPIDLDDFPQGIDSQMAGVQRSLRQSASGFDQFFPAQLASFVERLSLHHFAQQRRTGHAGDATLRQKSNFIDTSSVYFHCQFKNIAAHGIVDLDGYVRIDHFSRVARMLEVVEDLRGIHRTNCIVTRR